MEIASTKPDTTAVVPREHAVGRGNGKAPRVLIVDDDPAIRMLCSINLTSVGFDILQAADGRAALARARAERPDLVLTDVKMPGLDGFQLAAELRRDRRTRDIPLIFLSGETLAANDARALSLGALAYLRKPFDPATLASLVAGVLARRAGLAAEGLPAS